VPSLVPFNFGEEIGNGLPAPLVAKVKDNDHRIDILVKVWVSYKHRLHEIFDPNGGNALSDEVMNGTKYEATLATMG
jgi:hypothetical protein